MPLRLGCRPRAPVWGLDILLVLTDSSSTALAYRAGSLHHAFKTVPLKLDILAWILPVLVQIGVWLWL